MFIYCPFSIRLRNNYVNLLILCRSVLCGGSTAIFMFGYGIYFYARSRMSGFLQLSFFIGYNACICYAFFLIFGAISFRVSLLFVRHIYHNVKREWIFQGLKHNVTLVKLHDWWTLLFGKWSLHSLITVYSLIEFFNKDIYAEIVFCIDFHPNQD